MRAVAAFVLLLGLGVVVAPSQAGSAATCPATVLTHTGPQTTAVYQSNPGGTWDLTGAVWTNSPNPLVYPIRSDSWTAGCISGGYVDGNTPEGLTREQTYGGSLYDDAEGIRVNVKAGSWLSVTDTRVDDVEDAFDPNGGSTSATTYLNHVRTGRIYDDCIENEDVVHNIYVDDSLFDGCFTGFAERPSDASTAQNGSGPSTFSVTGSLVYIKPQLLGTSYCSSSHEADGRCKPTGTSGQWLGAYGIWKWSTAASATVVVRDTIFRLDQPSYSSCSSQRWPAGTYENVTLVWTGAGSYASAGGCSNVLPAGVTLTTDVSVWDNAKAAWLAGGSPSPSPSPTVSPSPSPSPTGCQ